MKERTIEIIVGLFMLIGIVALLVLALEVSNLTAITNGDYYKVYADFDNVGDLKERAPITLSGVKIGQVGHIGLNRQTFKARVEFFISKRDNNLPTDTSARIVTAGLLGSNYISLQPGFDQTTLVAGSAIQETHSALILEDIVGRLLLKFTIPKSEPGQQSQDSSKKGGSE